MRIVLVLAISLLSVSIGRAHDAWVQTNTNLVRVGDVALIDLMLGNHGNDHRDFKLAGKVGLERCTLEVVAPGGQKYDIKPQLIDTGYAPREGYWSARFVNGEPGLYTIAYSGEGGHGTTRSLKSAKVYFLASESLDRPRHEHSEYKQPLGHWLELVPLSNPVLPMGPGLPIRVQVLYHGEPLADARVSFIPRGETLAEGLDATYERMTDGDGTATFTPKEGNLYLIVVHHLEPHEAGEGYDETKYCATLTVYVPQVCPCCGE